MGYTTNFQGKFGVRRKADVKYFPFIEEVREGKYDALVPLLDLLKENGDPRGEEYEFAVEMSFLNNFDPKDFWPLFGLEEKHVKYLKAFSESRRMRRNSLIAEKLRDPKRISVGLPIGKEGEYFVGGRGFFGQDDDDSVVDHNKPPITQPGLWCQWVPSEDGTSIQWDGGEKFYKYVEWLKYLIKNFLSPWGYELNGRVEWEGEERSDTGAIFVDGNIVMVTPSNRTFGGRRTL